MSRIDFKVDGDVRGKGRPRFANRGNFVQTYTDEKTLSYENLVKFNSSLVMCGNPPIDCHCYVSIEVNVSVPNSWSATKKRKALNGEIIPTTKPDLDNVAKIILDGMNGIVFRDDKQVARLMISKRYNESSNALISVIWH